MTRRARVLLAAALVAVVLVAGASCRDRAAPGEFRKRYTTVSADVDGRFRVNRWDLLPGDALELAYDLDVDFHRDVRDAVRDGVKGVWVVWIGERLFDEDGRYRRMQNVQFSTKLSTVGTAVENSQTLAPSRRMGHFYGTPIDVADYFPLTAAQIERGFHLAGSFRREVDAAFPPGLYRPQFYLVLDTRLRGPQSLVSFNSLFTDLVTPYTYRLFARLKAMLGPWQTDFTLPMVQVGRVRRPRMPWTLFPGSQENGMSGVAANEDRDRFALSSRLRFPSDLILPPGDREIAPCFPTVFPEVAAPAESAGALNAGFSEHHLRFDDGWVAAKVVAPNGAVTDLGVKRFVGVGTGGPRLEGGSFHYPFDRWGKYVVRLTGAIRDVHGREIGGGGTYEFYVARWLTFSTTVKHQLNFEVGYPFPAKVEILPPLPADVRIVLDFYPNSDPARKRTHVFAGRASRYGYYRSIDPAERFVFDEPGEYRAEITATYRESDGSLWRGSQTAVGIVEGEHAGAVLHGMRGAQDNGLWDVSRPNLGWRDRYDLNKEYIPMLSILTMGNVIPMSVPYRSGDVFYLSTVFSYVSHSPRTVISVEPRSAALRRVLLERLRPTPYLTSVFSMNPPNTPSPPGEYPLRLNGESNLVYVVRDGERADMLPVVSLSDNGYQPFVHPEHEDVEMYAHVSVTRPGFSAFVLTCDSTAESTYWSTSPYGFGGMFNAGDNGDLTNDLYAVSAGLVVKDRAAGTVDYSSYSSTIVITPYGRYNDHVAAPGQEPLLVMNGKTQWLGVAMATSLVLQVGEGVSVGSEVFPAVPAHVETTWTAPDGRVERVEGTADRNGLFPGKVFVPDRPGVYQVKAIASYNGRTGDVFGSQNGMFYHFVVPRDATPILSLGLPPVSPYDVLKILEIPIEVDRAYRDVVLSYAVVTPGIIMDQGRIPLPENATRFKFIPSQFAAEFPNFDVDSFKLNRPKLNKLVAFVFFVEATGPDGRKAYDARRVFIRQDRVYAFEPLEPAGPGPHAAARERK